VLQQAGPGQILSNVKLAVAKETELAVFDAKDTVKLVDGSLLRATWKVAVPPSLIDVGFAERIIVIVLESIVEIVVVAETIPAPLPVIVTDSLAVLASVTPVSKTACGTFQLVVVKVRVVGEAVTANVLEEPIVTVLVVPGFPESATAMREVEPSVTDTDPVNTGFVSFSIVSNAELALVIEGAVAEMVTFSDVSFTSSTPVSVTVLFVLQQFTPGQTLSNVNVVVDNEMEPALLVASVTVVEGLGSALSLTSIVEVPPSATVVPLGVRIMAITVESTVATFVVAPPRSTPLAVTVTVSAEVFASETPVINTACGIFQLDALNVSVAGVIVIAAVFPETKFIVLVPFGFPDKATDSNAVEPSLTVVAPVNTALLSLSAVSILNDDAVVAGAVAVIATVSVVSFTSSTPVIVTVCAVLQQFGPGHTLSNVMDAVPNVREPTVPDARDTTRDGVGSAPSFTVKLAVPPSLMLVGFPARIILIVFTSTVLMVAVALPKSTPFPVMVTASEIIFASLTPVIVTDCGTFQLVALKVKVEVESVMANGLLETRFKVLAPFGFPES